MRTEPLSPTEVRIFPFLVVRSTLLVDVEEFLSSIVTERLFTRECETVLIRKLGGDLNDFIYTYKHPGSLSITSQAYYITTAELLAWSKNDYIKFERVFDHTIN